jgi:hypothetical protein
MLGRHTPGGCFLMCGIGCKEQHDLEHSPTNERNGRGSPAGIWLRRVAPLRLEQDALISVLSATGDFEADLNKFIEFYRGHYLSLTKIVTADAHHVELRSEHGRLGNLHPAVVIFVPDAVPPTCSIGTFELIGYVSREDGQALVLRSLRSGKEVAVRIDTSNRPATFEVWNGNWFSYGKLITTKASLFADNQKNSLPVSTPKIGIEQSPFRISSAPQPVLMRQERLRQRMEEYRLRHG